MDPNTDEAIGTHRGNSEALNIRNPQPGFHYYYERSKPANILRRLNEKWEFVKDTDPEQWGAQLPPEVGQALDGLKAYGDVVLMRIHEDNYRVLRDQKALLAKASREGTTDDWTNKGHQQASKLGDRAPSDDMYYARRGHGNS
jgi:hypothetical protein